MTYFRQLLLFIRSKRSWNYKGLTFAGASFALAGVITVLWVILDNFIPFNFVTNGIRGVMSIIVGLSLLSATYTYLIAREEQLYIENSLYQPIRQRFSHKQRKNIAALGYTILVIYLILMKPNGALYTFKSSMIIYIALMLLLFARSYRDEYIRELYGIPDLRDLAFEDEVRKKEANPKIKKEKKSKTKKKKNKKKTSDEKL